MTDTDIRTIVTHADCPDGIASALILLDALPAARVLFVQHNTPGLRDLPAVPGMLFCDIVPPRERVAEFVDAGAIVLDHHRGARDIVAAFGARGVFADEAEEPGTSGAVLAFREVWLPVCSDRVIIRDRVALFAELAGVRDTWQRLDPRWRSACAQAAALRFWPWQRLAAHAGAWLEIEQMLGIGTVLLDKDEERDARTIAEAHRFTASNGVRVLCFDGTHTSDIADRVASDTDLVLGWHYVSEGDRSRLSVSCRSRGHVSALALAKAHGGGGHTQASGFMVPAPSAHPVEFLRGLVDAMPIGEAVPHG